MKHLVKLFLSSFLVTVTLAGCASYRPLTIPPLTTNNVKEKASELSKDQLKHWSHMDLATDTVPGMSVDLAYDDIIKNNKGKTTLVAVIDSGIDIDHEDLRDVIWTNPNEIPNNGKDDDKNGYVDDIHGWNFLGDGYDEQLEYVRLLASGDTSNPRYAEAQAEYEKEVKKYTMYKMQTDKIYQAVASANEAVSKFLNKTYYTKEDLENIETEDSTLVQQVGVLKYILNYGFDSVADAIKSIQKDQNNINDRLDYNLNKDFKGRKTNDNIDDLTDIGYGDNNVKPKEQGEEHGTHVTGIIAAERNNNIGVDGVANNVKIMAIRTVPNGDEYDKDVALAIRYAADNGAKVVNMSFGKSYSPHSDWVRDAIAYAAKKDVLLIHAAGNDHLDLDKNFNYPNDQVDNGPEVSDNLLTVGALNPHFDSKMVARYSNYGKINVDVFAPGSDIYSTIPNNQYDSFNGTSMAAPAVAGVAAMIRSQYPKLTASQVKHIIMDSGLLLTTKVEVGGDPNNSGPFNDLSSSGKIVNLYNGLILASKTNPL